MELSWNVVEDSTDRLIIVPKNLVNGSNQFSFGSKFCCGKPARILVGPCYPCSGGGLNFIGVAILGGNDAAAKYKQEQEE